MSTIKVLNMAGAEVGTVELNDAIFGIEPNTVVVHEVVKNTVKHNAEKKGAAGISNNPQKASARVNPQKASARNK